MERKLLTEEIFNKMYLDYNKKMTLEEISKKYGFEKTTISKHFNDRGLYFSNAKRFSKEELDNIVNDYNSGMKPYELAKKYNRQSGTIIEKLRSMGVYNCVNYKFTDNDIEFLKVYYPLGDWDSIKKRFPNVGKQSIHTKMSKLGICADKYHKTKKWSNKELKILKDNYIYGNIDNLTTLIPNRTYKAITTKAKRLGLKTRDFWSQEEIDIMKQNYHSKTLDEIMSLLPNRTRNSIIAEGIKLNLCSICKYDENETQYIIDNWKVLSDKEMASYLNRHYRGVIGKRLALGLLREKEDSSYNDLSEYIRRNNSEWKTQSMINCEYKCILSGNRFNDIHHIHGLNLILNETLLELNIEIKSSIDDYTEKELRDILELFRITQSKYPLGVCLSKNIHMLFHNKYGYGNNTQEQWDEFVSDYKQGKYNNFTNVA